MTFGLLFPHTAYTSEDSPIVINPLVDDLFYPLLSLYSLGSNSQSTATTALGATISITSDGRVLYDPTKSTLIQSLAAGETATDTFTYTERTLFGLVTHTESVVVTGLNDTPIITSGPVAFAVNEQPGVTGSATLDSATGTLAFRDVDLSDTHTVSVSVRSSTISSGAISTALQAALNTALAASVTSDSKGNTASTGTIGLNFAVPDKTLDGLQAGQKVTETYAVTVADNHGGTATQTVTVTITGANDAPVAQPGLIAINPGLAVSGSVVAIDPDIGDVLSYALVTGPAHGTLTLQTNGQYSFRPATGFTGADSFVFSATDPSGVSSSSTVQIQVAPYVGQVIPIPYAPSGAADVRVSGTTVPDTDQVAALTNGGDVVVWSASSGSDTDENGIYLQRYTATGAASGGIVQVNTTTAGEQVHPTVAGLSNGTTVVAWESDAVGGRVIDYQLYDAAGNKLGTEGVVAPAVPGDRLFPSVTALTGGGFAVTWQGFDELNQVNAFDIYARTFNADGTARSGVITVNPGDGGRSTERGRPDPDGGRAEGRPRGHHLDGPHRRGRRRRGDLRAHPEC